MVQSGYRALFLTRLEETTSFYIYIYIYIYIYKIQSYFDSCKSSADWQWNEKCTNYTELDQLKKTKQTKSRLKIKIKML